MGGPLSFARMERTQRRRGDIAERGPLAAVLHSQRRPDFAHDAQRLRTAARIASMRSVAVRLLGASDRRPPRLGSVYRGGDHPMRAARATPSHVRLPALAYRLS